MDIDAIFKTWAFRFSQRFVGLLLPFEGESSNSATPEQLWQFVREDPCAQQRLQDLLDGKDASEINVYRVCRDIREGRLKMDEASRMQLAMRLEGLGFDDAQISNILIPLISTARQVPATFDSAFWSRLRPQAQRLQAH